MAATARELGEQIASLEQQEKEAIKHHQQAEREEIKAWPLDEKNPRDARAYADATTRRANWHSKHLRTVGELEDQRRILRLITDPQEKDRWLADAADVLKGE